MTLVFRMVEADAEKTQFVLSNLDLPIVGNGVVLRFGHENGRLRLFIEVFESTNERDLRQIWPAVKKWNERLTAWQGTELDHRILFDELCGRHEAGESYQSLANYLNERIRGHMVDYLRDVQFLHSLKSQGVTDGSILFEELRAGRFRFCVQATKAKQIMSIMGLSDIETDEWLESIQNACERNEAPWIKKDGPISRDNVREKIRWWGKPA